MNDIKVRDIIRECDGVLICGSEDTTCYNFSTDTRTLNLGDVYVGIKGENFDGSMLYQKAFENGASVCILDTFEIPNSDIEKYRDKVIVQVNNTVVALQKLAKYKLSMYPNIPVIGVTGSVGKTSTKDIIASVVAKKYKVLKTEGNLNSEIGMPLMILKLKGHDAAVLEMGTDKFGDLSLLSNIANPNICVITNVGTSHIANFGSRENILKGKLEILEGMCKDKFLVLNNDNDLLNNWIKDNKAKYVNDGYEIVTYGIDTKSDYMANNITLEEFGSKYSIDISENAYTVDVPVGGNHFVYNSLAAFAIGKHLGISIEDILAGIRDFELTKMRMDINRFKNNVLIVNDTYNASYDSMKAGVEYIKGINIPKKVAVLGDMLELGEYSEELHRKVGTCVAENNIDVLVAIGKEARYIAEEAKKCGTSEVYVCDNNKEAINIIENNIKFSDMAILIKASRGMKLEEIYSYMKELLK